MSSSCPMSAKASPRPRSSPGTSRSATIVTEDQPLVDVMTDKATVEITSPGRRHRVALARRARRDGSRSAPSWWCSRSRRRQRAPAATAAAARRRSQQARARARHQHRPRRQRASRAGTRVATASSAGRAGGRRRAVATRAPGDKPLASPAVRQHARELGIELQFVPGTGPAGRITHEDLDAFAAVALGARRAPCGLRHRARYEGVEDESRSSACAARSPRRCRSPSAASRISPMSRRST